MMTDITVILAAAVVVVADTTKTETEKRTGTNGTGIGEIGTETKEIDSKVGNSIFNEKVGLVLPFLNHFIKIRSTNASLLLIFLKFYFINLYPI